MLRWQRSSQMRRDSSMERGWTFGVMQLYA